MGKTDAERQREHQARHLAALKACAAGHEQIVADLRAQLDAALAENEQLAAMACKHPAAAVDGGTCRACGTDVW